MTVILKEKIFSEEDDKSLNIKKPTKDRPNIDNLIKRIINERKKQQKMNLLTLLFFLSVTLVSVIYFING